MLIKDTFPYNVYSHGPHPVERSIGQTKTDELAVMVDTFSPLKITKNAIDLSDGKYYKSWV